MNDDELGRQLVDLVPNPAPDYWAAVDAPPWSGNRSTGPVRRRSAGAAAALGS